MKRFSFTLEPVLSLRRQTEEQAREALARELAVQAELEAELWSANLLVEQATRNGSAAAGGSSDAAQLVQRQAYLERLERRRREAGARVAVQKGRVEAQRARLEHCAADRRTVERLRERAQERHHSEEAHEAGILIDEIATSAFVRRAQAEA